MSIHKIVYDYFMETSIGEVNGSLRMAIESLAFQDSVSKHDISALLLLQGFMEQLDQALYYRMPKLIEDTTRNESGPSEHLEQNGRQIDGAGDKNVSGSQD